MNPPTPKNPDTPRKASGRQHINLDIETARTLVVADLGDIPQVSVDFFIESVLPQIDLPESDIERVRDLLQSKDGLSHHFRHAPAETEGKEPEVFAPLKEMFDVIANTLQSETRSIRLKYVHSPGNTPGSERANATRPDSHIELLIPKSCKGSTSASAWADIAIVLEEKKFKDASTILDNNRKVIWSGRHMLSNDPCRRFAFGITIENEQMKLWQFSRAHVIVSEPFNWRQNLSTLIHIFGKLAFASDVDLGYDPTVVRFLRPDGKIRYKIEIEGNVYVTKKALTDFKSDPIRGRATRVWETYLEGDESKTSVVLKDIWLDSDSELEGDLQKQLIEDLQNLPTHPNYEDGEYDEDRKEAEKRPNYPQAYAVENPAQYFLTVVTHGLVKIDGVVDDTKDLMLHGSDLPTGKIYRPVPLPARAARATIPSSDRVRPVGGAPRAHEEADVSSRPQKFKIKRFQPKKHYRIVFLEVGTPIHDLTSFEDIFKALSDITRAIHCLYLLGYVHRDISTGNILFYMGGGKLCDLEFAKHVTTDSSHEVKTGTPHFIAVEIRDRRYQFITRKSSYDELTTGKLRKPVLRYNTLHDLESAWWIAVWVLLFKSPLTGIALPDSHVRSRESFFPSDHRSYGHRYRILAHPRCFEKKVQNFPENFKFLSNLLERGRRVLTTHYAEAEKKVPVAVDHWWRVHEYMGDVFDQIREKCAGIDALWAAENAKKRPAETLDDDIGFIDSYASSVDADPPRKRHNTGSIPPPSLHKSVRSQFSTKTSSQRSRRRTPPGSISETAYHTRSHSSLS